MELSFWEEALSVVRNEKKRRMNDNGKKVKSLIERGRDIKTVHFTLFIKKFSCYFESRLSLKYQKFHKAAVSFFFDIVVELEPL